MASPLSRAKSAGGSASSSSSSSSSSSTSPPKAARISSAPGENAATYVPLQRLEQYTAVERRASPHWSSDELLMARTGVMHGSWKEVDQIASDERLALQMAEADFASAKGSRDIGQARRSALMTRAEAERLAAEIAAMEEAEKQARQAALAAIAESDAELAARLHREEEALRHKNEMVRQLEDWKMAQALQSREAPAPPPSEDDVRLAHALHAAEVARANTPKEHADDAQLARQLFEAERAREASTPREHADDAQLARRLFEAERARAAPVVHDEDIQLARELAAAEAAAAGSARPVEHAADVELAKRLQRIEIKRAYSHSGVLTPGPPPAPAPAVADGSRRGSSAVQLQGTGGAPSSSDLARRGSASNATRPAAS